MEQAERPTLSFRRQVGPPVPVRVTTLSDIEEPSENNFSLLRLAAAVSVVISHSFLLSTGETFAQPLSGVGRYNLGQHAVHVFFVLSGIMVAGSLDRSASLGSFALARALRILPGLALCALLTAFVLGPVVTSLPLASYFGSAEPYVYPAQILKLVKITVPLPGVFEANPHPVILNEPLWTLKFEALCYVILAIMAATGVWRSERLFLAVMMSSLLISALISTRQVAPSAFTVIDNAARFWLCFGLGLTLYKYRARVPLSWSVLAGAAALWWFGRGTRIEPVLSFLVAGYGAVMLAAMPAGRLRNWANRCDLSYGVYIYGWPTGQALVWALPGIQPTALALVSLLVSAVLASLSWTWVERPSLRARGLIARWFATRRKGGVAAPDVRTP